MTELWIATTNQGKINEFKSLMGQKGVELHAASELKVYSAPPETGATFIDNARIKAKSMKAMKPGKWVVADDSGLEVDGLGNLPGVHSARYAGPKASDAENNAKVLKMVQIRSPLKREARFICVFVVYDPAGNEHVIEGKVEGKIAEKSAGNAGFGYDHVFIPAGESKTFGELGIAFKNKISHRGQAIRKLAELMKLDAPATRAP